MDSAIIFPNNSGGIVICYPCECGLSVQEIARKDVPPGKPFRIINSDQIPTDHTFFAAFESDFSSPDGYGIGPDAWFAEQAAKGK